MLENSPSPEQLEPKQLEPNQLEQTDTQSTQLLNESVRRELEQSGLLNSNLNLCLNIVSHCKGDLEKIKEF